MDKAPALNSRQQEAVLATEGPLLVLAGAGAGKTKVIAERVAQLVRQGVEPRAILAITFTNKAAQEMRRRILPGPFVATFHTLGLTIIKEHYRALGLRGFPAIYDRADSLREVKRALRAAGAEDVDPRSALGTISRYKGEGVAAEEFAEAPQTPYERQLALAWLAYERALAKDGALDFDDLLSRSTRFLRDNADARAAYQQRWRYIHVDEYQDTNVIQNELAQLLVGPEKNICVVGDPDQTIYSWRGAVIENILQFEKRFAPARVVTLEENYRSTQKILAAANELIANNTNRPEKNLFTQNGEGEQLVVYAAGDGGDEALFVARKIQELLREGAQPQDIAVLYRANFQSRAIEEKLLQSDIPHQVLGTRFYERKEVKDALSYVRAALYGTPEDLRRAVETPSRGIGKVTLLKLLEGKPIGGALGEKVGAFRALLARIRDAAAAMPPAQLMHFVAVESGMERLYQQDKLEGAERLENLRELESLALRYESVEDFLAAAALASEQDELKEERNAVRLMTVHAAKGLEFPHVFIIGLEQGLFPYERSGEDDMQEERRLMYVALTRAQKRVFLSYAMMRVMFGSLDPHRAHSQFLLELPQDLLSADLPAGRQGALGKTIYLE